MRMLPKLFVAGTMLAGLAVVPASAQTTAYADGPNGPREITLSIPVTASVGGRCAFADAGAPSGTYNQPNFDVTGLNHDFAFALECTGPSRVAVISANGGMQTAGAAPSGYATLAPYDVTLNLVGSGGTANATCQAATLVTGSTCSFLGPASTTQGLRLASNSVNLTGSYLRVTAPPYAGAAQLIEGNYADTLTVTVSAAP